MMQNTSWVGRSKIGSQSKTSRPGGAHALVAPPGDPLGACGALVAADAEAVYEPTAEARMCLEMAAQLALDRSALMLGGTPSLWDSREFTALLDAVQQRFAGRNGRQDQWYAAGKRRLDMFARRMGWLKSYRQFARLRKAASIRNSIVVPLILSQGTTEILTSDFMRLSMIRPGMYGYRRSYSERLLIVVHDAMSGYNSCFSSSP